MGILFISAMDTHKLENYEEPKENDLIVHIRMKQAKGKKVITTVENLEKHLKNEEADEEKKISLKKICSELKKYCCCNGKLIEKENRGITILSLQGDQRQNVQQFFKEKNIIKKEQTEIHP